MITLPALAGAVLGGFSWVHVPLLLFWWVGYFFFQAAALWLKSHRRAKYFPPVRAYGLAMVPFGVATAVMRPALAAWALAFAPLVGIAAKSAWDRTERSLLNDGATVLAACLMFPVARAAGAGRPDVGWAWTWTAFAIELAYFWGTVPHVKSLIRERDNPRFARFSLGYHAVVTLVVLVATVAGALDRTPLRGWLLVGLWVALCVRTLVMPRLQTAGRPLRPAVIGIVEVVFSTAITLALVV